MHISEYRQRLKHAKTKKIEIRKFCKQKKITNINFVEEKISGTKDWKKRKLGNLLNIMKEGDTLVLTELSRLGRSMMIFSILEILLKKKIKVYAIKENYELGDNIQSQVLAFAFSISAQVERDLISERTKMGLERARREGKHIGRKKGQLSKKLKLTGKGAYIKRELKKKEARIL